MLLKRKNVGIEPKELAAFAVPPDSAGLGVGTVHDRFVPKDVSILLFKDDRGDTKVDGRRIAALLAYNCSGRQIRHGRLAKRPCRNCQEKQKDERILPDCTLLVIPATNPRRLLFASCMECILAGSDCELAPILSAAAGGTVRGTTATTGTPSRTMTPSDKPESSPSVPQSDSKASELETSDINVKESSRSSRLAKRKHEEDPSQHEKRHKKT